jgi:hypothetical protein
MTMFIPAPIFGGISEKEANFVDMVVRFIIDFPAWTCIGLFLAYIYGIAVFDQTPKAFLDSCGPYEFWFHEFLFFSLVGLYWSRHFYAWLWRIFKKVFHVTSVY